MSINETYTALSDTSLFCLIKQGDQRAFTELYNRYSGVLYAFIYVYLKESESTRDLLQNIFMSIWEKRAHININTQVKNYLYTAAKNCVINHIRQQRYSIDYSDTVAREKRNTMPSPEQIYEREEMNHLIDKAINDLQSETKRQIIELRRQGLSNREVSDRLNVPENTVRIYYSQSVRALRDHFKRHFNL